MGLVLLLGPVLAGAQTADDRPIGRTTCYDHNGFIVACPVTLDDETMDQSLPSPRFIDNGDDTVSDALLDMVWIKDARGSILEWVAKRKPRFLEHADGTMTDIDTGLIWLRDANCIASTYPGFDKVEREEDGRVTWKQARTFIDRLNDDRYFKCNAGYNDWRLPTLGELARLAADNGDKVTTALEEQGFVNVVPVYYWSSTENLVNIYYAWAVSMQNGQAFNLPKTMGLNVWPVRTPPLEADNSTGPPPPR